MVEQSVLPGARAGPRLSIIIPTLNEGDILAVQLASLAPLRERGVELIVVDGGSADASIDAARRAADRLVAASRGRARQMNAGAAMAKAPILLFLHADTRLPPNADLLIDEKLVATGRGWGR